MAIRAGLVGGSGYTGAELLRLLAAHPDVEVVAVTADSNAGAAVGSLYPSLVGAYGSLTYRRFEPADFAGLDLVFFALPHGESQRLVPDIVDDVGHVVDLGADFRLPAGAYRQWYGDDHAAPQLLDAFAFGLPELFRADIRAHRHVAAPGCYPTAATIALAPLIAAGTIERTGIVVNACSGVSGRGRGLSAPSLYSEANENVSPYGLLTHRHTAEIELALGRVADSVVTVLFTPHLVPMTRGIVATCTARPAIAGLSTAELLAQYREFYTGEPFVTVLDEPPSSKPTVTSNAVHTTVRFDERTGTVLAIAAEDNLVKGAAGQAIQAANLLLDLPEAAGLSPVGVLP
ncbi:MAG: N-acetyl-gamma-glutamyl-phosphate reductase [Acidimicrobiia bacterium]